MRSFPPRGRKPGRRAGRRAGPATDDPDALSRALEVGDRHANQSFPGVLESVPRARRWIDGLVGRGHPLYEATRLLTSELVANAVRHSRSGEDGGQIFLTARVSRRSVRVTVRDQGADTEPQLRQASPDSTGGRGLALVDFIADRWDWTHDNGTCVVWFEISHEAAL